MSNWHTETMKRFAGLSYDQLIFIRRDAREAADAGKGFNPKVGQYEDEVHYASMELHKRQLVRLSA